MCRQIIGAAYELVHPRLSVGAPSAHDAVAEFAEPLWPAALVEMLTKLNGSSPARSAKACTAVEVSMDLRLFNGGTQLMITLGDVAGPVACKAILDQLAQGTIGFTVLRKMGTPLGDGRWWPEAHRRVGWTCRALSAIRSGLAAFVKRKRKATLRRWFTK